MEADGHTRKRKKPLMWKDNEKMFPTGKCLAPHKKTAPQKGKLSMSRGEKNRPLARL